MPIYEYKCPQCAQVFEEWVKTHDTGPQDCPHCGTSSPHIVSNTSFVLKGGGWYVTEYGNRSAADSAPETPSASGGEAPAAPASSAPAETASAPAPAAPASAPAAPAPKSGEASPASAA